MTVLLAAAVAALVGAVLVGALVVLGMQLVAERRRGFELPPGLNRDVLERLARMQGDLDARLLSVDRRIEGVTEMFASPQGRGGWGELSLRQALEHAGLVEGRDYELNRAKGGDGGRPDGVINLPDGRRIVIDAKFPIARFRDACAAESADERERLMGEHGQTLVRMARDLKSRGYHSEATGGFIVMYVPEEGLYVEAMRARPGLFDEVRRQGVLLAGPVTLLALLGVTAQAIGEHRALEEARLIVADTKEFQVRLATFAKHLADVGKKLNTVVKGYNSAVGSWESRLVPQVDKLAARAPGGAEPDRPAVVETAVRELPVGGEHRLTTAGQA
ncbi:MAG: DNA recombination protein RmuC [Acidobacteria bacterium]|nr:DNA recombination protein RmuC [Acidobacteriota bacterium]